MQAMMRNLKSGLRLTLLLPVHPGQLRVSSGQFWLLATLFGLLVFSTDWMLTAPPREFNPFGIWELALALLGVAAGAYAAGRCTASPNLQFQLPFCLLAALCVLVPVAALSTFVADTLAQDRLHPLALPLVFMAWGWAITLRAISGCTRSGVISRAAAAALIVAALAAPDFYYPQPGFWYTGWAEEEAAAEPQEPLEAEQVFFDQPGLLAERLRGMLPQQGGRADLYLIGLAGYGAQDVFRREIDRLGLIAESALGSGLRFLPLVNHRETLSRYPLASLTNLEAATESIGRMMNAEEDVLFLYITSHGSEEHQIALELGNLPFSPLTPETLHAALDRARVRWKVVVVSACFSGGYMQQIASADTLVITAARADRHSFGCENDADMTWFGRAFLDQGLALGLGFEAAFNHAEAQVHKWEVEQGLEHSEPQIHVGSAIRAKLREMNLL